MGDEAARDDETERELEVGWPGAESAAAQIAARYSLPPSIALERLIDTLFGISCRDQEIDGCDPAEMAVRRREGYELAKRIQQSADLLLSVKETLYNDVRTFNDVVRDNPSLIESIFIVDTGGPAQLCLPSEIAALGLEYKKPYVEERIAALAALPVHANLPRGPVPNTVLRDALRRLRAYWISFSSRSWAMSSLRHKEVREDNAADTLAGDCERFVVDVLRVAGIRFSFSELASAWTAVDKSAVLSAKAASGALT